MKTRDLHPDSAFAGSRLDRYLAAVLTDYSRSFLQKLIRDAHVTVDGRPAKVSQILDGGETVHVTIPEPEAVDTVAEAIPLDIRYEDDDLLVINKPAGMVVHPGAGVRRGTLVNALLHHCGSLSEVGGRQRPGIVHRLDKDTTGLLVVAKTDITHRGLQAQFAEKSAFRLYRALVWGVPDPPDGTLDTFLNRSKSNRKKFAVADSGKRAVTHYRVEEALAAFSLVAVRLETGRTHQIRVHMNHLHHPIFGDPDYNGRRTQLGRLSSLSDRNFALYWLERLSRQALHAAVLTFRHPRDGREIRLEAELPADFERVLAAMRDRERTP